MLHMIYPQSTVDAVVSYVDKKYRGNIYAAIWWVGGCQWWLDVWKQVGRGVPESPASLSEALYQWTHMKVDYEE
jgi:hypothetical protein